MPRLHPNFHHLAQTLKTSPTAKLLVFLLSLDILFIVLYILFLFTDLLRDVGFSLQRDQGYSEVYQYVKWAGLAWLFGGLFKKERSPLYLYWAGLFACLLLDDALLLHENAGARLAEVMQLPAWFSVGGRHWGEFIVFAGLGLFFLTTLLVAYQRSDRKARELSQSLILFLFGFVFFAVFLDLVHASIINRQLSAWLAVIEDGGEMIIISLMIWNLMREIPRTPDDEIPAQTHTAMQAAALFGVFALLFGLLQFSTPGLVGNDGYYHAKMGLLIQQQGPKPTPPHLPHTILNEEAYYDHHFLYHSYLSLFTSVDPRTDGGGELTRSVKVASIWLPALAFVAIWWLLRKQGVPWAWLWGLGLFALSGDFLYRLSMPRTQSASLLILALALHWLYQKRYRWLALLGFLYVWTYNAFPLLLVVAGIHLFTLWLTERRWAWQALAYPAVGILLGLLINPYFPENLPFIFNHLLPKATNSLTPVGSEWYPYETWYLIQDSGWAFALLLVGVFALGWHEKRPNSTTLTAFFLTLIFGVMLFKSRRFIEYFPAFVLIFTALASIPFLKPGEPTPSPRMRWLPIILLLLLAFPFLQTLQTARTSLQNSRPADQYAAAALWLNVYAEPDSTVFQLDWDDFTRLFFYDSDKVYTVGLDPTFMELHDPELYALWVAITQGRVAPPSHVIRTDFDADYVFSDLEHDEFLTRAFEDPGLEEIYRDGYAIIFKVLESE